MNSLALGGPVEKAPASPRFGDVVPLRRSPDVAVAFTVIEAGAGKACPAKTFGVGSDGRPVVQHHGAQPGAGIARRVTAAGSPGEALAKIANVLDAMTARQALVCAPPPSGRDAWPFTTRKEADGRSDVITRTQDHFRTVSGPALFGLDFDVKAWPAVVRNRLAEMKANLSDVLGTAAPTFATAAGLMRPSSSVGVRNKETGAETDRGAGQHRFFIASDGRDVARAVGALHERLILTGWGYGFVHETGFVEVRSPIDRTASTTPERLWFEGQTQLADARLEHVPDGRKPKVINPGGSVVDLASIVDLSADERSRLDAIYAEIVASLREEAAAKRVAWKDKRKAALIAGGVDPERAAKTVGEAIERHVLIDDFSVSFDDGSAATVSEILANPMAFHKMTGPDPLEPDYGGGRNKAVVFGDANPVRIESVAHGGISYVLQEVAGHFENADTASAAFKPHRETADASTMPGSLFPNPSDPLDIFGDDEPAALGEMPAGSLPTVLERWSRTEARRKGVQPSFPAAASMAVAASAIGASLKINVRQHDDWSEPASLWVALIAPPGSTKTPVISAAVKPLRKLDGDWLKTDGPIYAEWEKASRPRRKADAPPLGPKPRVRRAVVDDVTSERLIGIFADNPTGLLRDTDELAGVFGGLGAYKANSDGDRSQLLRLFDGGSISRDRQTAASAYAETALLGIIAASQPDKIRKMVEGLGADGMLQRFLFVSHDGIERKGIDEAPDVEAVRRYDHVIRGLKTAEYRFQHAIRLTPAASRAMDAAADRLSTLRHMPGAGPAFQDHVSKWGKFLPRLVLTFHALEEFDRFDRVDPEKQIEVAAVEMAARFARFLMLHSIRFYETFFATPEAVSEARWVAGHLLTKPELREIGRRDVYDARKTLRGPDFRPLLAVMSELEAAGWVDVTKRENDGPSRWSVNGRIHARFAARADRERRERGEKHARLQTAGQERRRLMGQPDNVSVTFSVFD